MWSLLLACTGLVPDSAADSSDSSDSSADSVVEGPAWHDQTWVSWLELPAERGLAFELDEDFFVEDTSVPSLLITDAGLKLLLTNMNEWGGISALSSSDGVTWSQTPEMLVTADDAGGACGRYLVDVAVVYQDDGYGLIVEGLDEPDRRFCALSSSDGETWEDQGVAWVGTELDEGSISVPEVLRHRDGHWLLYYLGDLGDGIGGGDNIRLATSEDGLVWDSRVAEGMLPSHDTDPFPVWLTGGGVRLYHTHPVSEGLVAATDSVDGESFESSVLVTGLDPRDEHDGEKWLDPVVVHLPDGRIVAYFTRIRSGGGSIQSVGVGRAWAVD
ncbi:MAG: hypothetical protein GY913_22445 [Proteobacteria bacterium]|nr:hypothetical protein [Pseudomonadota bacterium]MCP4919670.1 hypothetical protein [Pseudomonadota bacterium]